MDQESTCWHAAHTDNWTLKAELTNDGWLATVYNHGDNTIAYSELAASATDAKVKALYFLVGVAPPTTFHKGSSIQLRWSRCTEEILDSE